MSLLSHVRGLYSLDVLDSRLTTSSTAPPAAAQKTTPTGTSREAEARDGSRQAIVAKSQPPLWHTAEFYAYKAIVALAVFSMIKCIYEISKPTHPTYKNYEHLLSPGWIPGRKADNSDAQYASFRDNLPYMFALVFLHPLLRRLFNAIIPSTAIPVPGVSHKGIAAEASFVQRITFDRYFGLIFIVALHGFSAAKILIILYTNFFIAHRLPRNYVPVTTWVFNIVLLFSNELLQGYSMGSVASVLLPLSVGKDGKNWGDHLDAFGGLIPRWEVLFKITILRLISYNMDHYWSLAQRGSNPLEKKQLDPAALSERDRVSLPADPQHYTFPTYLAYALYSPLYIAGPILTFNDYISQCHYPPSTVTRSRVVSYGLRFLVALLCMEVMIHYAYPIAISKAIKDWTVYTPFQLGMLGYFSLHHIWLKLLLPWRFFRLWALADGIDPPENMVRCVSDNYSAAAFWRSWHRSFYRFTLRYIYIPLGGAGGREGKGKFGPLRSLLNMLSVFTFVAVWHDINLRLLIWGWLIVLFIAPEMLATLAFPKRKWENRKTAYRILCGIGAAGNILMMMAANLVGFAVGVDGLLGMINGIVGSYLGIASLFLAYFVLYVGAQVMFEIREEEMRQGINLRY